MKGPHSSFYPSRSKMLLFRLSSIFLTLFISIILGEIFLRVIVHYELFGEHNGFTVFMKQYETNTKSVFSTIEKAGIFRLSQDPAVGWEPIPGSSTGNISINSSGFRGPEYKKERPVDTIRVAFLGDSETFGFHLRQNETLPGYLEKYLNTFSTKQQFQVLNFGVPGYNTAQELAVLKKKVIDFNPSIVILYYVLNDPLIANPVVLIKGGYLCRSYLYLAAVFLFKSYAVLDDIHSKSSSLVELYQNLHSTEYFTTVKRILRGMGTYLAQRKIRFIILIAPEVIGFQDWENYPYRNINEQLKKLSSQDIEIVDPIDYLSSKGHRPEEFWSTSYDCHKNAMANRLIASFLARHIIADM